MKFLALNIDFKGPNLDFLACARGHERTVCPKSRYSTVICQSFMKVVADRHGHATYHNKHL